MGFMCSSVISVVDVDIVQGWNDITHPGKPT